MCRLCKDRCGDKRRKHQQILPMQLLVSVLFASKQADFQTILGWTTSHKTKKNNSGLVGSNHLRKPHVSSSSWTLPLHKQKPSRTIVGIFRLSKPAVEDFTSKPILHSVFCWNCAPLRCCPSTLFHVDHFLHAGCKWSTMSWQVVKQSLAPKWEGLITSCSRLRRANLFRKINNPKCNTQSGATFRLQCEVYGVFWDFFDHRPCGVFLQQCFPFSTLHSCNVCWLQVVHNLFATTHQHLNCENPLEPFCNH